MVPPGTKDQDHWGGGGEGSLGRVGGEGRSSVLGVSLDVMDTVQVLETMDKWLRDKPGAHLVVTANPLTLIEAQKNSRYRQVLADADLVVPDGVGVVWALRRRGVEVPGRVAGIHLVDGLFSRLAQGSYSVFCVGARPGVIDHAVARIRARYPKLEIAGFTHGYQSDEVLEEMVCRAKPDVILAGLGQPRQELWLSQCLARSGATIGIGVGGVFDVWAGRVRQAPPWVEKMGMEWAFRVTQEPRRLWRLRRLPRFVWEVLFS